MNSENIIDVNEADFETQVINESDNKLVVVDFWAPWCGPCKQLTPLLEKIVGLSPNKVTLAKINIDENQQIAAQLKIQSIPAVFAFKDKQLVDAFQGVIPEKEIIKFLEKAIGSKLDNDFSLFYEEVQSLLSDKNFDLASKNLESFISENSKEIKAICLYAECLIGLNKVEAASDLLNSLDNDFINNEDVKKILKRIDLIKQKNKGPSIKELESLLTQSPKDLEIVFKIADNYFANNNFNDAFDILLKYYPKNQSVVKPKILNYFDVLGFKNESVVFYRKKLSSIMFA